MMWSMNESAITNSSNKLPHSRAKVRKIDFIGSQNTLTTSDNL